MLCTALSACPAHAGGYPIDIVPASLLRARLLLGVEVASTHEPFTVRTGTVLQYQLDPLTRSWLPRT